MDRNGKKSKATEPATNGQRSHQRHVGTTA